MIFMGTTQISTEKTVGEISALLSKSGLVKYIQIEYDGKEVNGVSFIVMVGEERMPFRLPARWEPVLKTMKADKKFPRHLCNNEQAKRVAWRQILRWTQAQLALVEIEMVDIKEVFMPYFMISKNQSLYEKFQNQNFLMIEHSK